eukprot:CAMPEP_0202858910 /NCGR_PEP_ID=MMETSP1391-20130828/1250_1 /ASSEMBLY_ACC=CAM_ASM_000867 /TAXON_ID=1034604 /ORGANISM="Chlamydomonas leiostraca, Strain SAG 11-49" /LENGTH=35 /DNA_ID= /DNA_START= /DNA_END= /DNA_ORIENTATION=
MCEAAHPATLCQMVTPCLVLAKTKGKQQQQACQLV